MFDSKWKNCGYSSTGRVLACGAKGAGSVPASHPICQVFCIGYLTFYFYPHPCGNNLSKDNFNIYKFAKFKLFKYIIV